MSFRRAVCLALAVSLVGARDPPRSVLDSDLELLQVQDELTRMVPEVPTPSQMRMGPKAAVPAGYTLTSPGCVNANTLVSHGVKTVEECAALCSSNAGCLAFEYGAKHGGAFANTIGACALQSSADSTGCDGTHWNSDLYVKIASAGASDDPHVSNLAGERFDVNVPGEYLFLRVPHDVDKPVLLQLNASVTSSAATACGLYITRVSLSGEWFGEDVVRVRSHARNVAGSNTAGNRTLWDFSMQVSRSGGSGKWSPFADGKPGETDRIYYDTKYDSGRSSVRAYAARKEELGRHPESQQFIFELEQGAGPAMLTISQASHQGLNIGVTNLDRLGYSQLGGLLGTDPHDKVVERFSDACLSTKATKKSMQQRIPQAAVIASAGW